MYCIVLLCVWFQLFEHFLLCGGGAGAAAAETRWVRRRRRRCFWKPKYYAFKWEDVLLYDISYLQHYKVHTHIIFISWIIISLTHYLTYPLIYRYTYGYIDGYIYIYTWMHCIMYRTLFYYLYLNRIYYSKHTHTHKIKVYDCISYSSDVALFVE